MHHSNSKLLPLPSRKPYGCIDGADSRSFTSFLRPAMYPSHPARRLGLVLQLLTLQYNTIPFPTGSTLYSPRFHFPAHELSSEPLHWRSASAAVQDRRQLRLPRGPRGRPQSGMDNMTHLRLAAMRTLSRSQFRRTQVEGCPSSCQLLALKRHDPFPLTLTRRT